MRAKHYFRSPFQTLVDPVQFSRSLFDLSQTDGGVEPVESERRQANKGRPIMSTGIKFGTDRINAPLDTFVNCHTGILSTLSAMTEMPDLLAAAERSRIIAATAERVFSDAALEHHADEERELFPAVLRSAQPGEESDRVQVMVARMTAEHRAVEALWKRLAPFIRLAARGKAVEGLNVQMLAELIEKYGAHAQYEEEEFLPLASEILGRDAHHMEALGLSIHMRHAKLPVAYI